MTRSEPDIEHGRKVMQGAWADDDWFIVTAESLAAVTAAGHDPDYAHFVYADLDEMHPAVRTVLLMQLYNPPPPEGLPLFTVVRSGEEPLFDAEAAAWAATLTPEEFREHYERVRRNWRNYTIRSEQE